MTNKVLSESAGLGQGPLVSMQNLSFNYGKKSVFSHLDLTIESGNIYGLLGKNGAGKTTLLKLLSGQLFPSEGTITSLSFDPTKRNPDMLKEIFYLPEEFPLPKMKLKEYLAMRTPFYPRFDHAQFETYYKNFELDVDQNINELSFGQKKKLLLSFGLASNTALLILDEPTNGLDIPSKKQFRQTVASAMTENRTFIISTHQVRDMENLIDPIIVLHNGVVIFKNSVDSVTDKYALHLCQKEPTPGEAVYSEKVLGGWMVMQERTDEDSQIPIDLETLFNAVIENPKTFGSNLSGGVQ
ncbi:ABC-type multidrug transport system, ATPase component [Sphaerochaeta pleomorpha str. Grapes]|uniref:ABC-type multidrug transport system, ATPase component n=1 Tax=Sphaerochaeta pleomorpha (strain ATCC BAA-1885 / DSM 22778 / Grapes) TaxID=158190 RepID=G8QTA8_SPHPG|nr:ATP-binding cassette domain-containing protein [Sphaerochaeta pleomorpha]AEV29075.1 ABC-type multidrug transport system, ATPase component [Sphaerochaeta pleomorpha str. Grapes]